MLRDKLLGALEVSGVQEFQDIAERTRRADAIRANINASVKAKREAERIAREQAKALATNE